MATRGMTARQLLIILSAVVVLIVGIGVPVAWKLFAGAGQPEKSGNSASLDSASTTSSALEPAAAGEASGEPLTVAATWPISKGCDGGTIVGMPSGSGGPEDFHSMRNIRRDLIDAGGGSLGTGFLTLNFSTGLTDRNISIVNLEPHIIRGNVSAPLWAFDPAGGCGGSVSRNFTLPLDRPTEFSDDGVEDEGSGLEPPQPEVRDTPLGPDFVITKSLGAEIKVRVLSCQANYEWNLTVEYVVAGESEKRRITTASFVSYGLGDGTSVYSGQDASGGIQAGVIRTIDGSVCG